MESQGTDPDTGSEIHGIGLSRASVRNDIVSIASIENIAISTSQTVEGVGPRAASQCVGRSSPTDDIVGCGGRSCDCQLLDVNSRQNNAVTELELFDSASGEKLVDRDLVRRICEGDDQILVVRRTLSKSDICNKCAVLEDIEPGSGPGIEDAQVPYDVNAITDFDDVGIIARPTNHGVVAEPALQAITSFDVFDTANSIESGYGIVARSGRLS